MLNTYEKRAKYITLFLTVFLLAFLGLYFFNSPKTPSFYYTGFFVQKTDAGYRTEVFIDNKGPYYINTIYSPKDSEAIPIDFNSRDSLIKNRKNIYIALDPYDTNLTGTTTQAALELNNIIEPLFNIRVSSAFIKEKDNYTVKTCPTENKEESVILLRLGNEAKVLKEGNCVILQGKEQLDILKEADAIIFSLLEIRKQA
ncbi:hypothetical protein J4231_01400 [Candidatus Woesearchaeota archaeon]|nr:hypothetical protein [Candidatus Woesearchaeota archaeon]